MREYLVVFLVATVVTYLLIYVFGLLIGQDIWQRVFTARSPGVARWAGAAAGVFLARLQPVAVGRGVVLVEVVARSSQRLGHQLGADDRAAVLDVGHAGDNVAEAAPEGISEAVAGTNSAGSPRKGLLQVIAVVQEVAI